MYQPESLKLAKLLLLAQSSRTAIKKADIRARLRRSNGEAPTRAEMASYIAEADDFLRTKLALKIVELPSVNLGTKGKTTPPRGELVLVSTMKMHRASLLASADPKDFGLLCFVLMLITISEDGVAYNEITLRAEKAGLVKPDDLPSIDASLQRLAGQRYLETLKIDEEQVRYFIGPYAMVTISQRDLRVIIVLHLFSKEETRQEGFEETNKNILTVLNRKLQLTGLPLEI